MTAASPGVSERILNKVEEVARDVAVVKSELPRITEQAADHEKRLRSLEARLWYALGAVGLLAFIVPIVSKYLLVP